MTAQWGVADAGEIAAALASQIVPLVQELLPNGRREGCEWRCGSIAGEKGRSLGIRLFGDRAGRWIDSARPSNRGDALDLVAAVYFKGDLRQAISWARTWPGLGGVGGAPPPAQRPQTARATEPDLQDELRRIAEARSIWDATVEGRGTPTEIYVRFRGAELPESGVLRYHPACPVDREGRYRLPAMVAAMTDPRTGQFCGIHRTFVRADGRGKAHMDRPKLMLGRAGVIRISTDDCIAYSVGICEGIETGLSIQQRIGFDAIWAVGSAGGIGRFPPLPWISTLWIFPDRDDAGTSIQAAHICAERWTKARREARMQLPPEGHDWNSRLAGTAP